MAQPETTAFRRARIVINLCWYGSAYCFHIDPGDGTTLPIYIASDNRERLSKKIYALKSSVVDLKVVEVPWSIGDVSGVKRYLKTIKESNAR